MRSDKPKAKPFQRWVMEEVLPSIRKTGAYGVGRADALSDPFPLRSIAPCYVDRILSLECENATLHAKIKRLAPKAAAAQKVLSYKSGSVTEWLGIDHTELLAWLVGNGWLFRTPDGSNWHPYQRKIEAGYLSWDKDPIGDDDVATRIVFTHKGVMRLAILMRPPRTWG